MSHSAVCDRCERKGLDAQLGETFAAEESIDRSGQLYCQGILDPFSVLIKFLQDRPAGVALHGYLVNRVLMETFGSAKRLGSYILVSRETVLCSRILPGCSASSLALRMS